MIGSSVSAQTGFQPLQKRTTYIRLGLSGVNSNGYYGAGGEKVALNRLEEQTYGFYSEYGYSKYVTGIVNVPGYRNLLVQESVDGPIQRVEAPGDIELGLKIGIFAGDNDIFNVTGIFGIPIGETSNASGLWSGDDEFNQLISFGYGHAFDPIPAWFNLKGGYNFRSEGYSDEIHVVGEIGVWPLSFLQLMLKARSVASQGNGDPEFLGGCYGYATNNRHLLAYGPEVALWFTDSFGLNLGMRSVISARNAPSAMAFTTGIFFLVSSSRESR